MMNKESDANSIQLVEAAWHFYNISKTTTSKITATEMLIDLEVLGGTERAFFYPPTNKTQWLKMPS